MIDVDLEEWSGSPVIRDVADKAYSRKPASASRYSSGKITPRQEVFNRNLASIARASGSREIPVDFFVKGRGRVYLDRGCVKMAEQFGMIESISIGPKGWVDVVTLKQGVRSGEG